MTKLLNKYLTHIWVVSIVLFLSAMGTTVYKNYVHTQMDMKMMKSLDKLMDYSEKQSNLIDKLLKSDK